MESKKKKKTKIHLQTLCLSLKKGTHIIIFNHYCCAIPLSCSKNTILFLVDTGKSMGSIVSTTGVYASTISRLCFRYHFELQKMIGSHLSKLFPTNIPYTAYLIVS